MRHLLTALLLAASQPAEAGPVLVELFTSQGCSSCPDADALLSGWGAERFRAGEVLPLSYDVDYWDYLGWKDVFSSPQFSRRQRAYAAALRVGVYTPQLVAGGRAACVGSDRRRVLAETGRLAGEAPAARLVLSPSPSTRIKLTVEARPAGERPGPLRVMLALFENGLSTEVRGGENRGRVLRSDFVVRRLVDLGELPAGAGGFRRLVEEPWGADWRRENVGVAVFLQDPATLAVRGAASLYPVSARR